jgi:uncharacterized membrane protein YhaH (DUF805 family)
MSTEGKEKKSLKLAIAGISSIRVSSYLVYTLPALLPLLSFFSMWASPLSSNGYDGLALFAGYLTLFLIFSIPAFILILYVAYQTVRVINGFRNKKTLGGGTSAPVGALTAELFNFKDTAGKGEFLKVVMYLAILYISFWLSSIFIGLSSAEFLSDAIFISHIVLLAWALVATVSVLARRLNEAGFAKGVVATLAALAFAFSGSLVAAALVNPSAIVNDRAEELVYSGFQEGVTDGYAEDVLGIKAPTENFGEFYVPAEDGYDDPNEYHELSAEEYAALAAQGGDVSANFYCDIKSCYDMTEDEYLAYLDRVAAEFQAAEEQYYREIDNAISDETNTLIAADPVLSLVDAMGKVSTAGLILLLLLGAFIPSRKEKD